MDISLRRSEDHDELDRLICTTTNASNATATVRSGSPSRVRRLLTFNMHWRDCAALFNDGATPTATTASTQCNPKNKREDPPNSRAINAKHFDSACSTDRPNRTACAHSEAPHPTHFHARVRCFVHTLGAL